MMVVRQPAFVLARRAVLGMIACLYAVSLCSAQSDETPRLIQELQSSSTFARLDAAAKIAELGPAAADAVPALIDALKCEQIDVLFEDAQVAASRQRFADALIRIGAKAVPQLEKALEDENGLVRVWAANALHSLGNERQRKQVIPILIDSLQENAEVAGDASMIIDKLGEDAAPAIPALIEQLGHRELAVRCNVAYALSAIARGDRARELRRALQHSNPLVPPGAVFALYRNDSPLPAEAIRVLEAALAHDSRDVRRQAVWAIGQFRTAAQPLVPALIKALANLEPEVREYFFGGVPGRQTVDPSLVLVAVGPGVKPELIGALDNENPKVRLLAAVALIRLDPKEASRAAPVLRAAREDADQMFRFFLDMTAPPPPTAAAQDVDALVQAALQGNGFGPPSPAMMQLVRRGSEAVEPLMKILKSGDGLAAARAGMILGRIGAPALPALEKAFHSDNDQLRVFAVGALATMGEPALPLLTQALQDDLYPVRRTARLALRALGTPAAMDALQKSATSAKQ